MPDDVSIKEVGNLRELRAFINFPVRLYASNPYWVPSLFLDDYYCLRRDKNPAFEHCEAKYWLAYRQNQIVGRIAAIHNQLHTKVWKQPYLRFGWVDFIDDLAVSSALFREVERWAHQRNLTAVHGPLGFTDLDREGMLIEGFEELGTLATIYNHPYYPVHLEKLGYAKDVDWVEFEMTVEAQELNPTISKIAKLSAERNNLKLIQVEKKKQILDYAQDIFQLLNDEYQHLFGFIPLTEKQVKVYVKQFFGFILPEFVPIVVDQNGKVVAFCIAMPSLSLALQRCQGKLLPTGFFHLMKALKHNERVDLCLIAVRSEYQRKGVNAILMDAMHKTFVQRGVVKIETNPELETNHNVQGQWKYYNPRQHKRRRCFIKHVDAQGHG